MKNIKVMKTINHELTHCISYEMAIRNKEVKLLLKI